MELLLLPNDLLKSILSWLSLRNLSEIAHVCKRFKCSTKEVLFERAIQGRQIDSQFKKALSLLEPKVKTWEFYLLLKLTFMEVEIDSLKIINIEYALMVAIYSNHIDLVKLWTRKFELILQKENNEAISLVCLNNLVKCCQIYQRKECFLILINEWKNIPLKPTTVALDPYIKNKYYEFPYQQIVDRLIPMGFLLLFDENERKLISQKLKCISPKLLFLAKKYERGKIKLDKLTSDQIILAYDLIPEDQISLINDPRLRNSIKYLYLIKKDGPIEGCPYHTHLRTISEKSPISLLNGLLKENKIEYEISGLASRYWCVEFKEDRRACQRDIMIKDLLADGMNPDEANAKVNEKYP